MVLKAPGFSPQIKGNLEHAKKDKHQFNEKYNQTAAQNTRLY